MPSVVIFGQHIAQLIRVAHNVGTDLLDHADKTRAPGASIEPNCEGSSRWVTHIRLDEQIVNLAIGFGRVEIAGVDGGADHSLNGGGNTVGVVTRSPSGSALINTAAIIKIRVDLIIYLLIIRYKFNIYQLLSTTELNKPQIQEAIE
jgi:hypothetical protein